MPRYVVLFHETPPADDRPSHWDFMLAAGDVLRTWALAELPRPGGTVTAQALPDHRPAYLDYEGPLSGGRGHVRRWDAGNYTLLDEREGRLRVQLAGHQLQGVATLTRQTEEGDEWSLAF